MSGYRKLFAIATLLLLLLSGAYTAHAQVEQASWTAEYWNNVGLEGSPALTRVESDLDHDWGFGAPPGISPDRFSARWTTSINVDEGTYRFTILSDDGVRVWVDDLRIIDNWTVHPETEDAATIPLDGGVHVITVEYFENTGLALISLDWEQVIDEEEENVQLTPTSGPPGTAALIAASGFTPNTPVVIGVGRAGAEPAVEYQETTNEDGVIQRQVVFPREEAQPGEAWRVLVRTPSTNESALSSAFTVTEGSEVGCGPTFTVEPGDWLARIARRCNTTVDALLAANSVIRDPNRIYPGQVLSIPQEEVTPQASITPESGSPGTGIQVNAIGFAPNDPLTAYLLPVGGEETFASQTVTTDNAGRVEVTLVLPQAATAGERWVAIVESDTQSARSESFVVVGADVTATTLYNVNLRPRPTTDSLALDTIPYGTTVPVLGRTQVGDWLHVRYAGQNGWLARALVDVRGSLGAVPAP